VRKMRPADADRIRSAAPAPKRTPQPRPVHHLPRMGEGGHTLCGLPREPGRRITLSREEATCKDCLALHTERPVRHPPHRCLACDGTIRPDEKEIRVPLRRRDYSMAIIRYQHADEMACRRAVMEDRHARVVSGGLMGGKR